MIRKNYEYVPSCLKISEEMNKDLLKFLSEPLECKNNNQKYIFRKIFLLICKAIDSVYYMPKFDTECSVAINFNYNYKWAEKFLFYSFYLDFRSNINQ